MNLNSIKQVSFSALYKKARSLFIRSNRDQRPVAYDWVCIIVLTTVVTASLVVTAVYFYFFYSTTPPSDVPLDTQTLTINRSVLSDTLNLLDTHERLFSKESEYPREVIDPSY